MLLNDKGIAIRNHNAAYLFNVEMHYGRTRFWINSIPADHAREACVIADNENTRAITTGRVEKVR